MFFQVGKVIVQTTAKQLPKLLTRFRGAKQIKNPTVAGEALYRATGTVDFELHESEETDLVIKILQLAGVSIKDPSVYQVGSAEEAKDVQQEKA